MDEDPPSYALSAARLRELHADGIRRFGGTLDVREPGCIEGLSSSALNSTRYHVDDLAHGALIYACYLLRNAVAGNCMVDGNKRLGWYAAMDVLALLGLTVEASSEEVVDGLYGMLHSRRPVEEVAAWMSDRLRAIDE